MKKLFVGNLPYAANEQDLTSFFADNGVTIDTVSPPSDKNVSIVQQSETHVTLKVPLRYSPLVRRINAISQWTELIKMPDGYDTTMDTTIMDSSLL